MDNLAGKKWDKLLRRARLFTFVPFVNLVFVAGSMAMGHIKKDSDFDFIIGVKSGRIFTARFFCHLFFGFFGWRRPRGMEGDAAKDRFCFSHFVTPEKYHFSPPYDKYSQELFASLVPIYGDSSEIQKFFDINTGWMNEGRVYKGDNRHIYKENSFLAKFLETILSGKFGNYIERRLRNLQLKRIERSSKFDKLHNPRIIFNDSELEFHPYTKQI